MWWLSRGPNGHSLSLRNLINSSASRLGSAWRRSERSRSLRRSIFFVSFYGSKSILAFEVIWDARDDHALPEEQRAF